MQLSDQLPCRLCRLTFALFLAWIWAGGPDSAMAQEQAPAPEQRAASADQLDRSIRAIADAEAALPRETFQLAAVTKTVGNDPAKLLAWVRDNTVWVPYHGSLRGEAGVLMDRLGNSLDRSLLLAALLKSTGHSVRLAHGQIPADHAAQLIEKVPTVAQINEKLLAALPRPATAPATVAGTQPAGDPLGDAIQQYGIDERGCRTALQKMTLQSQRLQEMMTTRLFTQTPVLAKLLDQKGDIKAAIQANRDAAVEALRDHWWVQRQDGGNWVDLDPLLPDAAGGSQLAQPTEMSALDQLAAEQFQQVEFRVIVERRDGAAVKQSTLLKHAVRPSQLVGKTVSVINMPMNWPKDLKLIGNEKVLQDFREAALAQTEWVPVLQIGKDQIVQASITPSGEVIEKPELDPNKRAGKGTGGAAGKAADLFGDPALAAAAGELTAQWLEYEIRTPNRPPQVIRREIFDVVGVANRAADKAFAMDEQARLDRALGMLSQTEVAVLSCRLSQPYLYHLWATGMTANRAALVSMVSGETDNADKLENTVTGFAPMMSELFMLASLRDTANPWWAYTYYDRPVILSQRMAFRPHDANGVAGSKAFDIVANVMGVQRWCPNAPPDVQLLQGVVDTNAEAVLMPQQRRSGNSADALAGAEERGQAWVTIEKADDERLGKSNLPPDAQERIRSDLAAGYRVLCPAEAGEGLSVSGATWWRVHPTTGETLGFNGNGWGATMTEWMVLSFLVGFIAGSMGCMFALASAGATMNINHAMVCVALGIAAGLMMVGIMGLVIAAEGGAAAGAAGAVGGAGGVGGSAGTLGGASTVGFGGGGGAVVGGGAVGGGAFGATGAGGLAGASTAGFGGGGGAVVGGGAVGGGAFGATGAAGLGGATTAGIGGGGVVVGGGAVGGGAFAGTAGGAGALNVLGGTLLP